VKKRILIIIACVLLVLAAFGGIAFAWPDYLNGRPSELRPGNSIGYYIWRDSSGFSLRTTSAERGHVFTGVIRTDGQFNDLRQRRNEPGDFMRLSPDRKSIHFRFTTPRNDMDGIDFSVQNGSRLSFDLLVDGRPVPARLIHLGTGSQHPGNNIFSISNRIAFAWPDYLNGRPSEFRPGNALGYFVWRDSSGFNLRTTTARRTHVFTGVVRTDGQFIDLRQVRNEPGDYVRIGPNAKTIRFRLTTRQNDADGFDFRVQSGSQVSFELLVDGNPVPVRLIHLGAGNRHPNSNNFTILRHQQR